jgi:dCMP deaminase
MDWDQYFISMCYLVAMKSKDPSTKVGCVIVGEDNEVVSTGFNSFPRLLNDNVPERAVRPLKHVFIEHAERNAIANAARIGASTKNCKMYMMWCPCVECARMVIQSGVKEIIVHKEFPGNLNHAGHWQESLIHGEQMLQECGVNLRWWSGQAVTPVAVYQSIAYPLDSLK